MNLRFAPVAAAALVALSGCQVLGPSSIGMGRGRYNDIIQSTSMEQTMGNIVRVAQHQPPMFMDVTEVDAVVSGGGSLTSGGGGLATRKSVGAAVTASGTMQYSETPTVRYQPLLGQALVAQLVTPVSADALGLLNDSYWDVAPLFDFSAAYLTLDPREFYPALNTIMELHDKESVELVASPSGLTRKDEKTSGSSKASSNNDSLNIYLLPNHEYGDVSEKTRILQLWVRMFRLYTADNQPPFTPAPGVAATCKSLHLSLAREDLTDWDVHIAAHVVGDDKAKNRILAEARACLPNFVELRVVPVPIGTKAATSAPLMRTYSALGILKNATELPSPRIEFVTPAKYTEIRNQPWNQDETGSSYYTLLPTELNSACANGGSSSGECEGLAPLGMSSSALNTLDGSVIGWLQASAAAPSAQASDADAADAAQAGYLHQKGIYEEAGANALDNLHVNRNGRLGTLRRYILVIKDDRLPGDGVYVSYYDGEKYYYIAKDDTVSQKNFQLISLFMSMMAVPPSTQPLSPVINVGG